MSQEAFHLSSHLVLSRNEDVLAEGHQKMSWADPVAHCDCCLIDSRDEDGKQLLVSPSQSPNCARSKATAHAELPGLAGKKKQPWAMWNHFTFQPEELPVEEKSSKPSPCISRPGMLDSWRWTQAHGASWV